MSSDRTSSGEPGRQADSNPGSQAPRINLEQQRKRAKDLLKAHRRRDEQAARRVLAHLPRAAGESLAAVGAAGLTLSEAQLVIAREAGFASWPRLVHGVEAAGRGAEARLNSLLEHLQTGDEPRVRALLEEDPEVARGSLHAACALADEAVALGLLEGDPAQAVRRAGPGEWTPLLYLCCARIAGQGASERTEAGPRARIAARLLELGADAKDSTPDARLVQGMRSVLSGAVAIARDLELARTLIGAGAGDAENLWHMAILGDAARRDSLEFMRLLLSLKPVAWELNGALVQRLEREDEAGVRLLIEAGAKPDASGVWGRVGTALHQAILARRGKGVLRALIDGGVDLARGDRDGRSAYSVAYRTAHDGALELLRAHGAGDEELRASDHVIAACMGPAQDPLPARQLAASAFQRTDHQLLPWAVRHGRVDAARRLLAVGIDADTVDDDGERALTLAAAAGELDLIDALLAAGARVDGADRLGRTALERALSVADESLRRALVERLLGHGAQAARLLSLPTDGALADRLRRAGAVERSDLGEAFERAAQALVDGELATLRGLLDEEPGLVHARSPRPHRVTLLHYLGANGLEAERQKTPPNAVEVMRLLLDAGSEPDALASTYGGGPAQTTLALLASSSWPAEAGLQGELVRVLCAAGANPDGLDDDGLPMATAIAFRCAQAVDALAELAHLDNALFAGAAGRIDLLETLVAADGRLHEGFEREHFCRVPWLHMSREPDRAAQQALICAAQFGRLECVRWLVERGVDPGGAPLDNRNALHEAAFAGHLDVVGYLLDQGVDPNQRENQYRSTALGWAAEGKRKEVFDLLVARCEPDLHDSVDFGLIDSVRRHLDRDPSQVDAPEGRGGLLRWAAHEGNRELVGLLLERGADRTLAGEGGKTAADLARQNGHEQVARLLEGES